MSVPFTLESAWKAYEDLLSVADAAKALANPIKFGREALVGVIPSIELVVNAPRLEAIFFVTPNFLGEVGISGEAFDFVDRRKVRLVRWALRKTEVQQVESGPITTFETASVEIHHETAVSTLNYVGLAREAWIEEVLRLLPVNLLLGR